MKRLLLLNLFTSCAIGFIAFGRADAATLTPITACADCHGSNPQTNQVPVEGSERNNPPRAIIGSHAYHINSQALTCSSCHVMPTTLDHRNNKIDMASPMAGGVTYSVAVGGSVPQNNQLNTTGMGTCTGTSCHSSGSPVFGTVSNCMTCHGYPPVTTVSDPDNNHQGTAVNHIGTLAGANTKTLFVSAHSGCQICHGTQSTTDGTGNTHDNHANYNPSTQHGSGSINMNGNTTAPLATSTRYDSSIRGCLNACHGSVAPYRMAAASGLPIVYGEYGAGGDCISCHTTAQTSPIAQGLNAAVTSRPAIVGSFSLASNHIRSRGGAVTKFDCGVCHMEGDAATGSPNATYHKNGYIELRDPDLGTTIKGVTWGGTGAGAYSSTGTDARPVRVSRNLSSATIEADTAAIMINHCLKCHDAGGATSTSAQVSGGSALKPFANTIAANPSGGVLDVATQFATTNRSYHPVRGKQNNAYAGGTRMVAPWNGVTKAGTTAVWGPLMTCWDCHADTGASGTITSFGVHGTTLNGSNVVALRGLSYSTGTTAATNYCFVCHAGYTNADNHGSGSAFNTLGRTGMGGINNLCINCHSSRNNSGQPARPIGAADAHGFTTRANGTAFAANNYGYAFIRSEGFYGSGYYSGTRSVGGTTYSSQCTGYNGTGSICSRSGMGTYTPGGVY